MKVQIWRNVIIQSKKRTMNDGFWRMNDFVVDAYLLLLDKNKAAYIFIAISGVHYLVSHTYVICCGRINSDLRYLRSLNSYKI